MAELRNRAEMRDDIRSDLNITPPSTWPTNDARYGPAGAQPLYRPKPTNDQINRALNDMLDIVNNKTGFHGTTIFYPVTAQTVQGYYTIPLDMNAFKTPGVSGQNLNTVRRVLWDNGTYNAGGPTNWTQVLVSDAIYFDRNQSIQDNAAASTPQYYFLRDGLLWITPAPSIAGYFQIGGGTGSLAMMSDTEFIDQIPSGYHQYIRRGAAQLISLMSAGSDLQGREMLQLLTPFVQDGVEQICDWYTQFQSEALTNTLGIVNMRRAYGTRRRK